MLHEQCEAWTHWGFNGQDHCWFFDSPPPPLPPDQLPSPPAGAAAGAAALASGPHNSAWPGLDPDFSAALAKLFGTREVLSGKRRSSEPLHLHLGGRNLGNLSCARHARILGSPFPLRVAHRPASAVVAAAATTTITTSHDVSAAAASPSGASFAAPSFSGGGASPGGTVFVASKPAATTGASRWCPRAVVGSGRGHWTRFDATTECGGAKVLEAPFENPGGHFPKPSVGKPADAADLVRDPRGLGLARARCRVPTRVGLLQRMRRICGVFFSLRDAVIDFCVDGQPR